MLIKVQLSGYENMSEGDEVDASTLPPERAGHFVFDPTLVVTDEDEEVLLDTFLKLLTTICQG